jgi:hypothetical protein
MHPFDCFFLGSSSPRGHPLRFPLPVRSTKSLFEIGYRAGVVITVATRFDEVLPVPRQKGPQNKF